jgi:hypothetical protein
MARHRANVSVTFRDPNSNGALRVIINIDTSGLSSRHGYDIVTFNVYKK